MAINIPIGSMYGIYVNIWGILMVNVTIYSIHGSYGIYQHLVSVTCSRGTLALSSDRSLTNLGIGGLAHESGEMGGKRGVIR